MMKKTLNFAFIKKIVVNRKDILICLFLLFSTVVVYWQVGQFEFVGFDDNEYVYENPNVTSGITINNLKWAFTAFHSNNWHPLTWISHMIDCQFFGLDAGWHHLSNLFLHILNTFLFFYIFRKMTGCVWQSAFIAAVFAIHPLHVESVAWVAERKDVLSTFFWGLTMISYYLYVKQPAIKRYLTVILCLALGLMTKPMLVTLPFVLLLLDYWPLSRISYNPFLSADNRKKMLFLFVEKVPLFMMIVSASIITFMAQKSGGVMKSLESFSVSSRVANAIVSYVNYIGKIVYPSKMAFLYIYPININRWQVALAFLLLLTISLYAFKKSKKRPYFIVGWFWYLGTLVPVIGLVQVGMQSMADRYTYVPMIGLLIIVAWMIPELVEQCKYKRPILSVASIITLAILMAVAWKQVGYWKNSTSILEHTLRVTSNNYIAHDTLGVQLFRNGKTEEAIRHYLQALTIYPDNHYTHFNLGVAFFQQGKTDEAIKHYLKAISLEPKYAKAYTNLGAAYYHLGDNEKALMNYSKSLEIKPDDFDALYNTGLVLYNLGKIERAISYFSKATRINPKLENAYYYLGLCWDQHSNIAEAIKNYRQFLRFQPESYKVHIFLGDAFVKQKNINKALEYYEKALAIKPDSLIAHYNIGTVYHNNKNWDEAIYHYLKALRLKPDFASGYYNLGLAFIEKGNIDGAIASFQAVLKISPENVQAKSNLEKILRVKNRKFTSEF